MLGEHVVSIKLFLFVCFVGLTISLFTYFRSLVQNQSPQVVYCDVGQGDGTYVRTITGIDIIIDAGPDSSILTCLGKYMLLSGPASIIISIPVIVRTYVPSPWP